MGHQGNALLSIVISDELVFCIVVLVVAGLLPWIANAGMLYILMPLRNRGQAVSPFLCSYHSIALDDIPPELKAGTLAAARQLHELGFTGVDHLQWEQPTFGCNYAVESVWMNPATVTSAHIIAMRVPHPPGPRQGQSHCNVVVTVVAQFTDGTVIETHNLGNINAFPQPEWNHAVRVPGLNNLAKLVALHEARVQRDRGERVPFLPASDQLVTHLNANIRRHMDFNCRGGYIYLDKSQRMYRKTVKGSFCLCWRLLWPWKGILELRDRAKLEQTITLLGLGHPYEYLPSPPPGAVATQVLDYKLPLPINSPSPARSPGEAAPPASS